MPRTREYEYAIYRSAYDRSAGRIPMTTCLPGGEVTRGRFSVPRWQSCQFSNLARCMCRLGFHAPLRPSAPCLTPTTRATTVASLTVRQFQIFAHPPSLIGVVARYRCARDLCLYYGDGSYYVRDLCLYYGDVVCGLFCFFL